MLPKETMEALTGAVGVTAEELTAAIKSDEEVDLTLKIKQPMTDDEMTTRTNNVLREVVQRYSTKELDGKPIAGETPDEIIQGLGKVVYDDSKAAALEMAIKKWKESNSADFTGKDLDSMVAFVKSQKTDTGDLEITIEGLRKNILQKDEEITGIKSDYEKRLSVSNVSQMTMDAIPDNLVDAIKKEQVRQLFLSIHEVETVDGKTTVKKNGEVIKDKQLLNPLPLDQVVGEFVKDNNWLSASRKGRGGGNEGGSVTGLEQIIDKDTFFEYCKENNIHGTSKQALEILNKLPKDVQEKVTA